MNTETGTDDRGDSVARFAETHFWRPHASPRSVWGLVATYPLFVLAVYRRSAGLLAATLCSVVANLARATPPTSDDAWATRVVLGERVWLERGLATRPEDVGLLTAGALVQAATFRAALRREPRRTLAGVLASLLLMFGFLDRMARLYDGTETEELTAHESGHDNQ